MRIMEAAKMKEIQNRVSGAEWRVSAPGRHGTPVRVLSAISVWGRTKKNTQWWILQHVLLSHIARTWVAQSLYCLTTDWMTDVRSPAKAKYIPCILFVQNISEAHPASSPMGKGVLCRGKARQGRDADHSSHLVLRSRMSRSYTSFPS
jgi:hypothetical protein